MDLHARSTTLQSALQDLIASHAAQVETLRCLAEQECPTEAGGRQGKGATLAEETLSTGAPESNAEPSVDVAPEFEPSRSEQVAQELGQSSHKLSLFGSSRPSVFGRARAAREGKLHEFWTSTPEWGPEALECGSPSSESDCESPLPRNSAKKISDANNTLDQKVGSTMKDDHTLGRCCVMTPNSKPNLAIAVLSLLVILYEVVSLPLIVAFQLEDSGVVSVLDLCACVFWTADIVVNFLTGYTEKDCVEMRMVKIARRYIRTWFFFDVVVVSFDWVTRIIQDLPGRVGFARVLKSPRFIRIFLRTLRLLRVVKLVMLLEDLVQCVVTDWLSNLITIVKMLFGLVMFNHFVACGWYAVGTAGTTEHWLDALDDTNASLSYRYIICFHWSMTQYTPAPNNYHPMNEHERIYACIILLVGICFFSAFLGKITSLITHLSTLAFARARDRRVLRHYLFLNKVTLEVANRIHMFLKNRQEVTQNVPYNDVRQFQDLPKSLATELQYQAHSHALDGHPLIWRLMEKTEDVYVRFVLRLSQAVEERGLKWGDELFHAGIPATTMVFVKHGELEYFSKSRSSSAVLGAALPCRWACEMALWCNWTCQGQLQARGVCIVLELDAQAFQRLAQGSRVIFCDLARYGQAYARSLLEAVRREERGPWDSDDPVDDCWGQAKHIQPLTEETYGVVLPARTTNALEQAHTAGWRIRMMRRASSSSL